MRPRVKRGLAAALPTVIFMMLYAAFACRSVLEAIVASVIIILVVGAFGFYLGYTDEPKEVRNRARVITAQEVWHRRR